MARIAFLGTGLLGSGIVEGMLSRGDAVTVWNRTRSKAEALVRLGAVVAETPEECAAAGDRVHMTLPDDAVVDAMLARVRPHLRDHASVIDHSTTSPAGTRDRIPRMQAHGVRFLHAPVFMSPQMARESKGAMLVSGPGPLYRAVEADLARMAVDVTWLGERPDLAASYKLFGNSLLFVITAGLADVFAMAKNLGIEPADALTVFSKFNVGGTIPFRGAKMARRDFSASFELTMARKDIGLMIEAAGAQPLVVLRSIADRMDRAIAAGHGEEDMCGIGETQ
jgi:3-hydroxyisobutyrate dehydrogenase-like beta-hydroxyacid dehydrogenase